MFVFVFTFQFSSQIYAQLDLLLASGNIEGAFQQALSASSSVHDVRFVLHVCEQTNPSDVFTPTQGKGDSVLPQNVLLSLIQQLSTDLTRKTDIKLKYVSSSIFPIFIELKNLLFLLDCLHLCFLFSDTFKRHY